MPVVEVGAENCGPIVKEIVVTKDSVQLDTAPEWMTFVDTSAIGLTYGTELFYIAGDYGGQELGMYTIDLRYKSDYLPLELYVDYTVIDFTDQVDC